MPKSVITGSLGPWVGSKHLFHFIIGGGKLDTLICMTHLCSEVPWEGTMCNLINSPLKKVQREEILAKVALFGLCNTLHYFQNTLSPYRNCLPVPRCLFNPMCQKSVSSKKCQKSVQNMLENCQNYVSFKVLLEKCLDENQICVK